MAKKIFLDAGHGGSDGGASKYVTEATVNIKVVEYIYDYLKDHYECNVKKDITADSIRTVVARANKWDADLFVSVHFNSGGGDGFEALVYGVGNKAMGKIFAKHAKAAGQNLRSSSVAAGVKYRPDLGVLRLTTMPAVLNEVAFVDNWQDIKDWNENDELKKMGEAMAKAAAEYLNLPEKKQKYKALSGMNFRKKPDLDAAEIGYIEEGTILTGTVDENGWLKTTYKGKAGYVRQKGQKVYMEKV